MTLPGQSALAAYLKKKDESPNAFALRAGIDQSDLSKILRGVRGQGRRATRQIRVTVEWAMKVEAATLGEVRVGMWAPVARKNGQTE